MWVLDHLDDLESDFSVFHRVEDIHALPGPRFFAMAVRIFAYDGVMTARLRAEQQEEETTVSPSFPMRERIERKPVTAVRFEMPDLIERVEV